MQESPRPSRPGLDLDSLATADLYRRNAFRLSGLEVDATPRRIRRRQSEIEAAQRIEGMELPGSDLPFQVEPKPSPDEVMAALRLLRDPAQRLLDEFFWLWPAPPGEPKTASAKQARELWNQLAHSSGGSARAVGVHNLAVERHRAVLERVIGRQKLASRWRSVYRLWRQVLDEDECWRWMAARVEAIDDPQLRPETVDELRRRLPRLLLSIHARIALAELGEHAISRLHMAAMRDSGFDRPVVEGALLGAVESQMSRLRSQAERVRRAPHDEGFERICQSAINDSRQDRHVLTNFLDDNPVVQGPIDDLASSVRERVVRSLNERPDAPAEEIERGVKWLDKALQFAAGPHVERQISEDIATLLSGIVVLRCQAAADAATGQEVDAQKRLIEKTQRPLERIRSLDAEAHRMRCDDVATVSWNLLITWANRRTSVGRGAGEVLPGLQKALRLTSDPDLHGRISKAIRDIEEIDRRVVPTPRTAPGLSTLGGGYLTDEQRRLLGELGVGADDLTGSPDPGLDHRCALCGNYLHFGSSRRVELSRSVGGVPQRDSVRLPFCHSCKDKKLTLVLPGCILFLLFVTGGVLLLFTLLLSSMTWSNMWPWLMVTGGLLYLANSWGAERGRRQHAVAQHPLLRDMIARGWRITR